MSFVGNAASAGSLWVTFESRLSAQPGQSYAFNVNSRFTVGGGSNGGQPYFVTTCYDSAMNPIYVSYPPVRSASVFTPSSTSCVIPPSTNLPIDIVSPGIQSSFVAGPVNVSLDLTAPSLSYVPPQPGLAPATSPFITQMRVEVLAALATTLSTYIPTSFATTTSVIAQFVALYDVTAADVSNLGWAQTTRSLQVLRSGVLTVMQQALAQKPGVLQRTFAQSVPDVVAAYSIFGDITQAATLTQINGSVTSLQLPTTVSFPSVS